MGSAAARILDWYDVNARILPWRIGPDDRAKGEAADPYRVWLSEIMLQQTTVATVKAYFKRFTERWPTVEALAASPRDGVLREWAGLGYYARARNLHACAVVVANEHDGAFPETEEGLRALPGIGPYTAAAIASIAFDRRAVVVDGNVERVIARYFAIHEPLPRSKGLLWDRAEVLTPEARPGDYAQAVMDLGATICTPKNPACGICPLMSDCAGRLAGIAETLPRKQPKKAKPTRYGVAYVAARADGSVLLRTRPETGLLGGMTEVPGSDWREGDGPEPPEGAPFKAKWEAAGEVRHTFTHFHLVLQVMRTVTKRKAASDGWWSDDPLSEALPTVMKKVVKLAQ